MKKNMPKRCSKHTFKPRKLSGLEAQAARKAAIARAPQQPNLNVSMKGGTSP